MIRPHKSTTAHFVYLMDELSRVNLNLSIIFIPITGHACLLLVSLLLLLQLWHCSSNAPVDRHVSCVFL